MRVDTARLISTLGFRPTGDIGGYTFYSRGAKRTVFFAKAPPTKPASYLQRANRYRMAAIAAAWRNAPEQVRNAWRQLAKRTRLKITPYDLFQHHYTRPQDLVIPTLLRQARMTMADLEPQQ
jgi:hypothetical protein